jgi:DNA-binding CsgD family transcriptional regulator
MLRDDYLSVLGAESADVLQARLVQFAGSAGFERVGVTIQFTPPFGSETVVALNNLPPQYSTAAFALDRVEQDPVAQHCRRSSMPLVWSQSNYVDCGLGPVWEHQAPFGYANGVAMALHMPKNWVLALGVDRHASLPQDPIQLTRLVADLQLLAVHASQAAERLFIHPAFAPQPSCLTPREVECLKWTMEGKTAWEVGAILGISERTAVLHVNNAAHKLDCVSKHQAVVKAIRLGLIH